MSGMIGKSQLVNKVAKLGLHYLYEDNSKPNAVTRIGDNIYHYDASGNVTYIERDTTWREPSWNEENNHFFFHTDHLGSTSYLTDNDGNVSQFVCYTPYGETLVDEHLTGVDSILHNVNYRTRYLFNGKELDNETLLYYYGARYYEPNIAVWYGVDPLAIMYPFNTGYVYCSANPVMRIDPDGRFDIETGEIEKGDNLTDITKQINQKYNTNFTVDQVAEANNIKNKDKIYAGNFIKLPGQEVKEREQTSDAISLSEITVHPDRTNRQLGRYNMLISGFGLSNGFKIELLDATVRYNYKSANSFREFNQLRRSQQLWRQTNTLGKAGAKYLRFSKGLGVAGFLIQTGVDFQQIAHAYKNDSPYLWNYVGRASLDITVGAIATFCGPVGWGIGAVYMIGDVLGVWDELFGLKGDEVYVKTK